MVWAFIFRDESITAENEPLEMEYNGNRLLVYGVNSVESGAALAKRLWEQDHCELVELCGGFGPSGAKRVIEVTGGDVRVGYVTKKFPAGI